MPPAVARVHLLTDELWIHVVGWERHQHPDAARSSVPPWIKMHTRLLDDPNYLDLTGPQRAVLHGLWLLYARTRREIRGSTARVTRQIGMRVTSAQLEALNHAGFIQFSASKVASLDREVDREREVPPVSPTPKPARSQPSKSVAVSRQDPVWDFVVELSGEPLPGRKAGHGRVTSDLRTLLERSLNGRSGDNAAVASELRRRHEALAAEFGEAKATARALVNHWDRAGKMADGLMRPPRQARPLGMADRLAAHSMQLRTQEDP